MTDIALDEIRRRVIAKAEATGFLSVEDIDDVFATVSPSPSQVAPANPAQVTDATDEAVRLAGDILMSHGLNAPEQVIYRAAREILETAAIGAGGQAVAKADQVFDAVLSCPHSIDAQSVVLKAAYDKPGNALKQLHDRITAALSQPHPADERVLEDIRQTVSVTMMRHIGPEGWTIGRGGCPRINWQQLCNELVDALSAKEGR